MQTYLEWTKAQLKNFRSQHLLWMKFSFLFVLLSIGVLIEWDIIINIKDRVAKTGIIAVFVVTSIFWWYWTMSLVKQLLCFKEKEVIILNDIVQDISEIKKEITKLKS